MSANDSGKARPVRRWKPVSLPPARISGYALIRIAMSDAGLFRYLLEAADNLATFTVIDPREGLIKLIFSPHQREQVMEYLESMQSMVHFEVSDWPQLP